MKDADPLKTQISYYQDWFDQNLANFRCSDPLIEKMFYQRAYLLKKSSMNPKIGAFRYKTFVKERWNSEIGANVISSVANFQIREARWLRDSSYVWGHLQTWTENQRPDGLFPTHITHKGQQGGKFAENIGSSAWDAYLVQPNKPLLEKVANSVARNALAWRKIFGWNNSPLLVVDDHQWASLSWQPSFFSFHNYELDKQPPLRRVDLTTFNFANAQSAANIYRELGRPEDSEKLQNLANETRDSLLSEMWNPKTNWFHSLRYSDNLKSPDKEIVGIYPFAFGIPPKGKGYESLWEVALDPKQFANNFVLRAMANTLRNYEKSALKKEKYYEFFESLTQNQNQNTNFASEWIDPLITGLIGIVPRADNILEIDPLLPHAKWRYYLLDGQSYRGHNITIAYDSEGENISPDFHGYAIFLDGKKLHHSQQAEHFYYNMTLTDPKNAIPMGTPATLMVHLRNIRCEKGSVTAYLYSSAEGFPNKIEKAFRTAKAIISENGGMVVFKEIPSGDYAIAVYHDENGDGKIEQSFLRIPKEGYGISNNVRGTFGLPSFRVAKFSIQSPQTTIEIRLRYAK